jgi:gluconolactonase
MSLRTSEFRVLASGLQYPEGPVYQSDGSVLVVEIKGQCLTQVFQDGRQPVRTPLGGGPNGAAIGPDGAVYVCNDGGMEFLAIGAVTVPTFMPPDYKGGSIQHVADSGVQEVYGPSKGNSLRSPDDLVFDETGNFWFTDWGKATPTSRDITGVYYAAADGSSLKLAIPGRAAPNGIALSPDNRRLYVAETYARWIVYWELSAAGVISPNPQTLDGSYLLTAKIPGQGTLDSMAVDECGNIYVATMLPDGPRPDRPGGITVIDSTGGILEFIELTAEGIPEPLPSNICFGGADHRTAFITLGGTGRLIACEMAIPGKPLNYQR